MKTYSMLALTAGTAFVFSASTSYAVPPGQRGGPTGLQQCMEIAESGSYVLEANLPGDDGLLGSGNCIEVSANDVSLDLGGFAISGPGSGNGITNGAAIENVSIANGTIVGYHFAVALQGIDHTIVTGLRTMNNTIGIALGNFSTAANNHVEGLGTAESGGLWGISCQQNCTISGNIVSHHVSSEWEAFAGFGITVGGGATVIGNITRENDIGIQTASSALLKDNNSYSDIHVGIFPGPNNLVVNNRAAVWNDTNCATLVLDNNYPSGLCP